MTIWKKTVEFHLISFMSASIQENKCPNDDPLMTPTDELFWYLSLMAPSNDFLLLVITSFDPCLTKMYSNFKHL